MSIKVLNKTNFNETVNNADKVVLVDFYADWCGPCKMLAPTINKLAEENTDSVDVYKVDIDQNMELAQQYGIMSIPTVVIFKDGRVIAQEVGVRPKHSYEAILDKAK